MEYEDSSCHDLTKKQRQYKSIFDNVTLPYLMSTLQDIADFVQDTTNSRILIREQNPEEIQFLNAVPNFITKESQYSQLPQQAQGVVKEIARTLDSYNVTLKVVVRRGKGRHWLKDVEIFKKSATSRGNNRKKNTDDICNIVMKKAEDYDPKQMFLLSLSRNNTGAASTAAEPARAQLDWRLHGPSDDHASSTEKKPKQNDSSGGGSGNRPSNTNYSLKSSGIKWQAAGSAEDYTVDKAVPFVRNNNDRRGGRRSVVAKHSKLLEALAKPLDCVPATRMMQKMGWTGGALGARGDGITEPIMPALDIVQGAGFGHSRDKRDHRQGGPNKKSSRSNSSNPTEFRVLVLENLLQLLKGAESEKDFQMRSAAGRKQIRFINTVLKSFNARRNVGLNTYEEKELIARIKENYASSDTLFVEVEYTNNYRTVTLIKSEKDYLVIKRSRESRRTRTRVDDNENESSGSSSEAEPEPGALVFYSKKDLRTIRSGLESVEPSLRRRALKSLANRVSVFRAILAFVKSDLDKATIGYKQCKISKRLKKFLNTVTNNINTRAKASYSSEAENDIYRDILRYAKSRLDFTVPNAKHFILERVDNKTRLEKPRTNLKKTETTKTDEPISDKPQSETNENETDNKTKEYLESDSEMSAISLKDYEVYDINLTDSSSDDSDSEHSQNGRLSRPWYRKKDIFKENTELPIRDSNEIHSNDYGLEKDCLYEVLASKTKNNSHISNVSDLNDHIDVISKDVGRINCSDNNNSANKDLCDLVTVKSNSENNCEKDTEKLLSLCKVNNLNDILNDDRAKVSVSIDIKMELNTNSIKKFTKEELIEKIENSSDLNIDFGITNDIPNSSKRTCEIFDVTQSSCSKKSKLDFAVAKIKFFDNVLVNKDAVIAIQKEIFSKINENNLPLLKFLNYDENSINYRCEDDKSFDWLKNMIENLDINNSKLIVTLSNELKKSRYKMKAVLNCFFDLNPTELLNKIELYNSNVKVKNWLVLNVKHENNLLVYILDIDLESYIAIRDCNFSLYCGIDAIDFSIFYD